MSAEYKNEIQQRLETLPDSCLNEVMQFLQFLEFKMQQGRPDHSSMLLSENAFAKEWLTPEEDEAWAHL